MTQYEDLGINAIKALGDIENYTDVTATALEDLNNVQYNNIGSALEGLKRQLLTSIAEPIGKELTPRINDLINSLRNIDTTSMVNGFMWIADNANNIATGIVAIGAGMATWNVVSSITGVASAIKDIQKAEEGLTIAQATLNLVMAANPIGLIITVVAALAAGLVYLWNTNEGFRNALIGAWTAISTTVGGVVTALVNFFTVTIPTAFNNFITTVSQVPSQVGAFFSSLPALIGGFLTQAIDTVIQWGANLIAWVATTIPQVIGNIGTFFNELPGKLGYALGLAIGTIIKWGIDLVNWVITTIPQIITNIINFFEQLPGNIATAFTNVLNAITQWGNNAMNWITTTVPQIVGSIVNFFSNLPSAIGNWFISTLNNIKQWGSNLISWASSAIPNVVSTIAGFFSSLPNHMLDIGSNIVKGIWQGIQNTVGWLEAKLGDFTSGIIRGIKASLGIHSPSRVMRDQVGAMIGAGMAEGIKNSVNLVSAAMGNLSKQVVANSSLSDFKSWISDFTQQLANGLNDSGVYLRNGALKLGTILADSVMPERDVRDTYFKAYNSGAMSAEKALIDLDAMIKRLQISSGNYEIDTRNLLGVMTDQSTEIGILTAEYNKLGQQYGYNSKQALDVLKSIQDLRTAYQQTGQKIKDSTIKNANDITGKIKESLKQRYQDEQKSAEDRIKLEADTQTKILQKKINAISNQAALMDIQNQDEDDTDKEAELRRQLSMHYGAAKKAELQDQLNELIKARDRRHAKENLDAQKQALQDQIDQIKDNSDQMLKNVNAFYTAKLNDVNINAEAEKAILQNNQNEILGILNNYGKDYELAGQSLGDRLVNGLKNSLSAMPDVLNGIATQINSLSSGLSQLSSSASGSTNINTTTGVSNTTQKSNDSPFKSITEPATIILKTYLDGNKIAETTAPYNNKIQGTGLALTGRGLRG